MEWLEPWRPVAGEEAAGLERVLRRELGPEHELFGLPVRALGRRHDRDDVLFAIEDGTGRVADVHLTWTERPPEKAPWPIANVFASINAWVREGMMSRPLQLFDNVRVVKLLNPARHFSGATGIERPPAVGDIGTICDVPPDPRAPLAVECVNGAGYTVWLADFFREELEFVELPA